MRTTPLYLALAVAVLDCASLSSIPSGTCGNGVVDSATEDCDSFPAACGAPSAGTKACRLTCDRSVAGSCPVGWGCSVDGICHQATGELLTATDPVSAGATTLLTGDFDADGRTDLLGAPAYGSSASARVHFFDDTASLAATVSIDVALRVPLVKDFDRDGIDDIGFGIAQNDVGAFGALSGRRDRSFSTILFPSVSLPQTRAAGVVIHADSRTGLPQDERSALVLVETDTNGNHLRNVNNNTASGGNTSLDIAFPVGPADLVGRPRTGILFQPTFASACGEVLAAYNDASGKGKIAIVSPCIRTTNPQTGATSVSWVGTAQSLTTVSVASNGTPLTLGPAGIFVGRWNGDDLDDVFVQTIEGNTTRVWVATSNGASLDPLQPLSFDMPLAVGDLDGDGVNDTVLPSGISEVEADGGVAPGTVRPQAGLSFADARIGQFNGDTIPDVLVRYAGALDAVVLGNNGDGRFTSYNVPSDQPIRAIESGDFDGDRIQDVAYLQSPRAFDDADGSGEVELVIAYGKANGGPETPRVIGRFANARELHTLQAEDSAVDNLAVIETTELEGKLPTTSVTVLFGSGERQPVAPLFLRDENSTTPYSDKRGGARGSFRVWDPLVLAAGAFGSAGNTDVFSIATGVTINLSGTRPEAIYPFPVGVWVAPSDPTSIGGLSTFTEIGSLDASFAPIESLTNLASYPVIATAGDIDYPKNGLDELIAFAQTANGTTYLSGLRAQDGAATAVAFPDLKITGGDPIALGDVDADGAPDLVVLTERSGVRQVLVFLHTGTASFSATPLSITIPATDAAAAQDPVAFAFLPVGTRADGKLQTDLAIAGSTRLVLAALRTDRSGFDVKDVTSRLDTAAKITSVAAGDFDGDGVTDLAIADSGAIRILRQSPRLP